MKPAAHQDEQSSPPANFAMPPRDEARSTLITNVIDMAVTFTAMIRIFESGSKSKIVPKLGAAFSELNSALDVNDFDAIHTRFCEWFVENVKTAFKILKGGKEKPSRPASYGHAAKVFDIAVKVYVQYCHLPDCASASRLLPFLHGAIDTPILDHLKVTYPNAEIPSTTIESVGRSEYQILQLLIARQIKEDFHGGIFPAQYDDIMWNRLNRAPASGDY